MNRTAGLLVQQINVIGGWVGADGGERWQLVNAHLPPIYAVRFA